MIKSELEPRLLATMVTKMTTKISIPLILLLLILCPKILWAVPAFVQSGYGECYPATRCNVDFGVPGIPGVPVTAGNLIVVTIRTDTHGAVCTSVTSQPGNQTCTVDRRQISETNFYLEVWSCPNATGGDTTVTVTCGGPADQMRIILTEYSGVALSDHVNATVSDFEDGDDSSVASAGTITTTVANALIHVAAAANHNNDAYLWEPGEGYEVPWLGGDPTGSDKTQTQHRVAATAGGYNTDMTLSSSDWWASVAVAYVPATSSPPSPPKNLQIIP
jgi:hypothetical protein